MANNSNQKNQDRDQDVKLEVRGERNDFDNLLADDAVIEWLNRLEREEDLRAAAG